MTADFAVQHQALLVRVSEKIAATSTPTDQLLLTRWRVLGLCQFLVGGGAGRAEEMTVRALEEFVREGPGRSTDESLKTIWSDRLSIVRLYNHSKQIAG